MKTKGAEDGIDDLFFAEVTFKRGEYSELVVSCFCMVKPTDNGIVCSSVNLHIVQNIMIWVVLM
jgi:hypothetical protein